MSTRYGVFDKVSSKCVGTITVERSYKSYTHIPCVAFVKGVAASFSYTLEAKDVKGGISAEQHARGGTVRDTG
jgi:hypothetical protein